MPLQKIMWGRMTSSAIELAVRRSFFTSYGVLHSAWLELPHLARTLYLAFTLNPKFVRAGNGTPVGIGLGANLQLAKNLQLIPEINIAANDIAGTNATVALRWLATMNTALDLFVSNAAGLVDVGQLLENVDQTRVGARITFQF